MRLLRRIFDDHLIIPLFFLLVYLVLPTAMIYTDGLDFAIFLERNEFGIEGIHPHHPLFLPLMWILYLPFKLAGVLSSLRFLQIISAITGAITIWLVMKLFERWGETKSNAAVAGFFMGGVFAFWHFATDASAYIPTLCIAIAGLLYVSNPGKFTFRRAVTASIIFLISVLMHQIAIFIFLAVLYFLFFHPDKIRFPLRRSVLFLLVFTGLMIITFLAGYASAKIMMTESTVTFREYLGSHASDRYFWTAFNIPSRKLLYEVARSHTHMFFHLRPQEWFFYDGERGDTMNTVLLYRSFTIISGILILGSFFSLIGMSREKKHLMRVHYLWLFLVFAFSVFFMPSNYFYRLFYLVPFIFLSAQFVKFVFQRIKRIIKPLIGLIVIVYYMFTLMYGILEDVPRDFPFHPNPFYGFTMQINEVVNDDDLLILGSEERYRTKYYRYFGECDCLKTTARIAYMEYWEDIWPNRHEFSEQTREYISRKYNRILISYDAFQDGEEYILLSTYNYPGDHPYVMMINKENLLKIDEFMSSKGIWYWMKME